KQKDLSDLDLQAIPGSDNQRMVVAKNKLLVSKFEDPIPVKESDDVKEVVKENVPSANAYTYWDWNTDLGVIMFFQKKNDQPVYYNDKGLLLLYLNRDNEITGYTQTMLGEENENFDTEEKPLIQPIQAIDTLYNQYKLYTGEEITELKLGYYTSQPIASDEQTLAPTWRITVQGEEERNYFIHAVEGSVFPNDDMAFLEDSLQSVKNSLATVKKDKEFKKISKQIDRRLEAMM